MRSLVGGSAVPEVLICAFAKHGITHGQGWGMTETSPLATMSHPRSELRDAGEAEGLRRAAMAGTPVPLVDVRIRGDDGRKAPHDGKSPGEVQVRGPCIAGSHHELPVSEDKFTADGWLRTGDVATMDELAFLRISDRTKVRPGPVRRVDCGVGAGCGLQPTALRRSAARPAVARQADDTKSVPLT
jgi:fatty-acyl-CoA synthase